MSQMGLRVVLNFLPDIRHGWWVQRARRIYALRIWNLCDRSSMCTSIIWNTVLYFTSARGIIAKRICKFKTCRLESVNKHGNSVKKHGNSENRFRNHWCTHPKSENTFGTPACNGRVLLKASQIHLAHVRVAQHPGACLVATERLGS